MDQNTTRVTNSSQCWTADQAESRIGLQNDAGDVGLLKVKCPVSVPSQV